ncbi:MAG: trypsin-like peptidase domain-containing protein [Deltaproteobacteria bacterium]|nr:trypsin-like peptidase domain-containing protein [Deltaproteobacteria bacterium]
MVAKEFMTFACRSRSLRMGFGVLPLMLSLVILILPGFLQNLRAAEPILTPIKNSIVKINVISQVPDYKVPWNPGRTTQNSGTGFLISDNRIITNAHLSSNARLVTLEKEGDSRKYEARVKFIAHDCDLAILEVLDTSFLEGMTPLSFGGVPPLDSAVTVIGYPIGGNRLSITRGIVSRIDYQIYSHSSIDSHLAIQIDAAINPGNSGGPVLQNDAVVGVAFQGYSGKIAQNVGYMIPVPVIQRFLEDVSDGHYDRYVDLGIFLFPLINPAHRRALGLAPGDYGVLVSGVLTAGASSGIIQTGDVLLSIEDFPIFSDGHVEMDGRRVLMAEVVERKFKNDKVHLKILRDYKEVTVIVSLTTPWPYLMLARRHGVRPQFVVFGGLVFQPLSLGFMKASGIQSIHIRYHYSLFLENELYLEKPEIIVISKVLPDPINTYLGGFVNSIVHKINNRPIKTLKDLAAALKEPADYYVIQLLDKDRPLVLERKTAMEANECSAKRIS